VLGIPEWALGVGLIIVLGAVTKIVVRLFVPESARPNLRLPFGDQADQLDQLKQRVSELEERLDFTERMLASQREAGRLDPPPR
jgi:hypothetical protein